MKLGIVGPAQSGKTTLLTLLTGEEPGADALAGRTITKVVKVPDARLEHLREVHQPKSFKPATFTVTDYGSGASKEARLGEERNADAFLVVLPAFAGQDPKRALADLDTEWTLLDLDTAERRIDKIDSRLKKPIPGKEKDELLAEQAIMRKVHAWVAAEKPLYDMALEPKELRAVKPYGLFTLKPRLVIVNLGESAVPYEDGATAKLGLPGALAVAAKLEAELTMMPADERAVFQGEYGIQQLARDRIVHAAYDLLGLHAFFTSGPDEVRAWTIAKGATAWEAAGEIHSDIQRGFIRAEVLGYADFVASGSNEKRAKADNKLRLEGKDYAVKDADIIEFRFSV